MRAMLKATGMGLVLCLAAMAFLMLGQSVVT